MSSKPSESLKLSLESLKLVLEKRNEGTADWPRECYRVDTAYQRALDRAGGGNLPSETRGGTHNPRDGEEHKVRGRVMRQAEIDARKIDELVIRLATATAELRKLTDRHAETVGPDKQDENTGLPGCRSCQRREQDGTLTIGGHWSAVYEKSVSSGLCRDCWEFKSATGGVPPVKWCHKVSTEGKKAANRWLATEYPKLLESVQRKTQPKTTITVDDLALRADEVMTAPSTT